MKQSDGPLPSLIAGILAVCLIATAMGFWWIWLPVILAVAVVIGSLGTPRR